MTTVITGSSGFVGTHLMKRIDAKPIYHPISLGHSWDCDQLFFLSTYGNMSHHADRRMMVAANIVDLLAIVSKFNGWFCYMSSSSVTLPVQTPYSRTKRAAEEILQALPELKSCIVRPYSVTGVGEQKEHLIPTLIRSCIEGEPMDFVPWANHDFVDVEDVVDGLISLSKGNHTGIHEFGSGIRYPNQTVLELVEKYTRKSANVNRIKSLRPYDSTDWCCKLPSSLFKPVKTLSQSISEMVEAYKNEQR